MSAVSRRDFLVSMGSCTLAIAAATLSGSARAAMGPDDKFDLLIKSGDVLDPSQSLRGKRDIGIRYGLIEVIEADIPAERALRVLDASGKALPFWQVGYGYVDLSKAIALVRSSGWKTKLANAQSAADARVKAADGKRVTRDSFWDSADALDRAGRPLNSFSTRLSYDRDGNATARHYASA